MAGDKNLRGSIIGGFNRKDVVNYIEKNAILAKQLRAERDSLESRLTELTAEHEALKNEYDDQKIDMLNSESKNILLSEKNDTLSAEITALQDALKERETENQLLQTELEANREIVDTYEKMKERLALLELNASRRAVSIENSAKEVSAELISRCRELIDSFRTGYGEICQDAEATTAHIKGEMDKLGFRLNGLTELLQKKSEIFVQLDNIVNKGVENGYDTKGF